jgi:hypothetical protein
MLIGAKAMLRLRPTLGLLIFAAGCGGRLGGHGGGGSGHVTSESGSAIPSGALSGDSSGALSGALLGSSGVTASSGTEASCVILESSYNQTCQLDTDCVAVNPGNFCAPIHPCFCGPTGVINGSSVEQFNADVATTPAFSDAAAPASCDCPPGPAPIGPCCVSGACQFGVTCLLTTSPDAASDNTMCPPTQPMTGSPCDGPVNCSYPGTCGPLTMTCGASSSYWAVSKSTPCAGGCPSAEPKKGDPCTAGGKCSYTSACGGNDIVFCDGTGSVSMVMAGGCPTCPDQEPAPLSGCGTPMSCMYTNACNGTDTATCAASTWTVLRGSCAATDAGLDSDVDGM